MKSKYQVILDDLTTLIENNTLYGPGAMLPTEKELSAQYGVSRTTIQRTLNILVDRGLISRTAGKGTFVKDNRAADRGDTQPKILMPQVCGDELAISERNFGPREAVMILPNHQAHVSLSYLRGAEIYLSTHGWSVTAIYSLNRDENVFTYVEQLANSGCGGIVVYPITSEDAQGVLMSRYRHGTALVTIDKGIVGAALPCVMSNNYLGGYLAAEYFLSRGHRTFFYIANMQHSDTLIERKHGFMDALADHAAAIDMMNVLEFPADDYSMVHHMLMNFFKDHMDSLPIAAFCASDIVAAQVYRAAYALDIRIPERLSVIGFDDLDIAGVMSPPLTTIAQDFFEIGRQAAALLMKANETRNMHTAKLYLPVKLVERESVSNMIDTSGNA